MSAAQTKTRSIRTTGQQSHRTKPGFRLQERDVRVVDAVHRLRALTTNQVGALFFPAAAGGVSSACRARLRHLANAGYLERAEQPVVRSEGRRPYVYFLTRQGRDLLVAELGYERADLDWKPSYNNVHWPFLAHQLAINDAYVSFSLAAERSSWRLESWVDDRLLRKAHATRVSIADDDGSEHEVALVPDAAFVLSQGDQDQRFFLEVDRATLAVAPSSRRTKSWRQKIQAYLAFYMSREIVERYTTNKIRMLTITTGPRRLESLQKATENVGGERRFWFAEMGHLTPRAVLTEPIWSVATEAGRHPLLRSA